MPTVKTNIFFCSIKLLQIWQLFISRVNSAVIEVSNFARSGLRWKDGTAINMTLPKIEKTLNPSLKDQPENLKAEIF